MLVRRVQARQGQPAWDSGPRCGDSPPVPSLQKSCTQLAQKFTRRVPLGPREELERLVSCDWRPHARRSWVAPTGCGSPGLRWR